METHGHAKRKEISSEYNSWRGMNERCDNQRHIGYKYYGGRGIKVCDRWRHSFANFVADMGRKPTPSHTIDRWPDVNGDYGPTNCRWATPAEQRLNQRPYDETSRVLKAWEGRSHTTKNRIDLTGQKFGRLEVKSSAGTKGRRAFWLCRCTCGVEKPISGKQLRSGMTKSCGCLKHDASGWDRKHT
jgi:hypothetical protein